MHDPRVLGDRQVGAQRQFLEDAAHAVDIGSGDAVARRHILPVDHDPAGVGSQGAGKHMHQRRLAGAIVADQADAALRRNDEVDARKRAHRAKTLGDAVEMDERGDLLVCHGVRYSEREIGF